MIIANYIEYIYAIRELYEKTVWNKANTYIHKAKENKFRDSKERIELQKEIAAIRMQIDKLRTEIKEADNKKDIGICIAEVQKKKANLAAKLKGAAAADRFKRLDNETKGCVCSSYLLQKYLTSELAKSGNLVKARLPDGSVILDIAKFRNSIYYEEAQHICDFVSSYIERSSDKVKSPGHFKTLLEKGSRWPDVYRKANEYFERWREEDIASPDVKELIEKSRSGVQVLKTFPDRGIQIVRLLTPEALDYEGKQMGHCIGGGAYDQPLVSGKSQFYSLRDLSENGEWCPHVTIEATHGKIKQIKGRKDRMVVGRYINETRDFAASLLGCKSVEGVDKKLILDWKNIGYYPDAEGKLADLYAIDKQTTCVLETVEMYGEDFRKINHIGNMVIGQLELKGEVDQFVLDKVSKLKLLKELKLKNVRFCDMKVLDFSEINIKGGDFEKKQDDDLAFRVGSLLYDAEQELGLPQFSKYRDAVKVDLSEQDLSGLDNILFNENVSGISLGACSQDLLRNICFSKYAKLKTLRISDAKIENFPSLGIPSGLEQLFLKNVVFGKHDEFDLTIFPNIKELDLEGSDFSLVKKVNLDAPNLEQLGLCQVKFGEISDFVFCNNKKLKGLNLVYLQGVNLKNIRLPDSLEHVCIQENDNLSAVLSVKNCEDMKKLSLGWNVDLQGIGLEERFPPHIEHFFCMKMDGKGIKSMDLSPFKDLKKFQVHDVDMPDLESLKFPDNVEEIELLGKNFSSLKKLDLSNCTKLKDLVLGVITMPELTELTFPDGLEKLNLCGMKFPILENIRLDNCLDLKNVSIQGIICPQLRTVSLPEHFVTNCMMSPRSCGEAEVFAPSGADADEVNKFCKAVNGKAVWQESKKMYPVFMPKQLVQAKSQPGGR